MNCSGYERHMSDYLDGQLSKATEDKLRFHLNGCPRCRLKIEDMESAIRVVKSLPAVSPQPGFEHRLGNLLNLEIARDLYAISWWRRVSGVLAELGAHSRQRPVQLVFASSLVLTISIIGGFGGLSSPRERSDPSTSPPMALVLPTPVESELAPPDTITPVLSEKTFPPHLAASPAQHQIQTSMLPSSAATSHSLNASRITSAGPGIMTVTTMEPRNHGIRSVLASSGMRLDPSLFGETFGRDLLTGGALDQSVTEERLQPIGTTGPGYAPRSPDTQGSSGPAAPLRRVRISF